MRPVLYMLVSLLVFGTVACKKDSAEWAWCTNCQSTDILGDYVGTANYLRYPDSIHFIQKNNLKVTLELKEIATGLQAATSVINVFYSSISGIYNEGHYLQFAGTNQSFAATIWRKDNQIKLVGTIKKTDSEGEIKELFDFEVIRKN